LAGAASRPAAALFAEHAQWGEGLHHAGGDRPAVRAALHRHHEERDLGAGVSVANPNGKIPAILDPDGPGGKPLALFESGAILIYLAEKTGKLLPTDPALRYEAIQWLMFQMAAIGPMFGQVGFFHRFAGKDYEDKRPRDRYVAESRRLLGVLEARLANDGGAPRDWIMGDYSIADVATLGWVRNLIGFYEAGELVGFEDFPNVAAWLARGLARPAVQRGLEIPARP
jgi:GST-like protein